MSAESILFLDSPPVLVIVCPSQALSALKTAGHLAHGIRIAGL